VGLIIAGCDRSPSEAGSSQNVLYHRLRLKVDVLDPANIAETASHGVGGEIFECLYEYHYLKRPYELIPQLAADMPQVSDERTELYRKAERIVVEDAPCAFMFHEIYYVMHRKWIKNFKPNAYKAMFFGCGLSKYYRVDAAKRDEYQRKYK